MQAGSSPKKRIIPLNVAANVQGMGDIVSSSPADLIGSPGMRVEGIAINTTIKDLEIWYMGHIQEKGDTPWRKNGEYIGTRGQQRRLEGFSVKLNGPAAQNYDVKYYARLHDLSLSPTMSNGMFVGTRGESKSMSGLAVWLESKIPNTEPKRTSIEVSM